MANTKLRRICFLLAISYGLSDRFVGGRKESPERKGTIKTIEGKNGDVIDCVDIYQQPAFDHPLLKNHIVEMKPSSTPYVTKGEFYDAEMFQGLLEIGECPEGTIPVRRAREDEDYSQRAMPLVPRRKDLNIIDNRAIQHEYALVSARDGPYLGAQGFINLWNPSTNAGEASIAQMSLRADPLLLYTLKAIEVGWIVNPKNNAEPRFFIRWTNDAYRKTGCFNLDCPGFVQVNHKFALGSSVKPISSYNGKQYELFISIFKTPTNGYWWLQVEGQFLGYWPSTLFTNDLHVPFTFTDVTWGGEIYDSRKTGRHTTTRMGSGHFPSEGFGKSSYFRNIQVMNDTRQFFKPDMKDLVPYATHSLCYDVSLANDNKVSYGTHFYFGGPGLSEKCP